MNYKNGCQFLGKNKAKINKYRLRKREYDRVGGVKKIVRKFKYCLEYRGVLEL